MKDSKKELWVTAALLRHLNACTDGVQWFTKQFPHGVLVEPASAGLVPYYRLEWLLNQLLSPKTIAVYNEWEQQRRDELYAAVDAARKVRNKDIRKGAYVRRCAVKHGTSATEATRSYAWWVRHSERCYEAAVKDLDTQFELHLARERIDYLYRAITRKRTLRALAQKKTRGACHGAAVDNRSAGCSAKAVSGRLA